MADARKGRKAFQALFPNIEANDQIIASLAVLTKRRQFTAWIRDMWRLWSDLTKGEITVLIELFPAFAQRWTMTDANEQIMAAIIELQSMLQSGQVVIGTPVQGEPVKIRGSDVVLPPPVFEDDDLVVIRKDTSAGSTAAANFLNSMLGIQDIKEAENTQTRPMNAIRTTSR